MERSSFSFWKRGLGEEGGMGDKERTGGRGRSEEEKKRKKWKKMNR